MNYKKGQKISKNGGIAKITSVNPDGTATANWVKPPTVAVNGVIQKKGGWAATLPALPKNIEKLNFDTGEIVETVETTNSDKQTIQSFLETHTPENTHERIGLPNELNPEEARIRMHNILIKDHSFMQDPDDIPGGCKTCWEQIDAYEETH